MPSPAKEHRVDSQRIEGAIFKELRLLADSRGFLMEILRADDGEYFNSELPFGQTYVTACYPGVVKGWHAHQFQHDRFCCLHGQAKVVLYDDRQLSPTHGLLNEFIMGQLSPKLLIIPPGVQHGFTALGTETALILNIPTKTYNYDDPDELRLDPHNSHIPYDWGRIDG